MEEEEEQAWRKLQEGIEILEEENGEWIKEEDKVERMPRSGEIKIQIRKPRIEIERRRDSLENVAGGQELDDKKESGRGSKILRKASQRRQMKKMTRNVKK